MCNVSVLGMAAEHRGPMNSRVIVVVELLKGSSFCYTILLTSLIRQNND